MIAGLIPAIRSVPGTLQAGRKAVCHRPVELVDGRQRSRSGCIVHDLLSGGNGKTERTRAVRVSPLCVQACSAHYYPRRVGRPPSPESNCRKTRRRASIPRARVQGNRRAQSEKARHDSVQRRLIESRWRTIDLDEMEEDPLDLIHCPQSRDTAVPNQDRRSYAGGSRTGGRPSHQQGTLRR